MKKNQFVQKMSELLVISVQHGVIRTITNPNAGSTMTNIVKAACDCSRAINYNEWGDKTNYETVLTTLKIKRFGDFAEKPATRANLEECRDACIQLFKQIWSDLDFPTVVADGNYPVAE